MTVSDWISTDKALTAVRYLLGLLILWWVVSRIDVSEGLAYLYALDRSLVALVLVLTALEFGTRFLMWHGLFAEIEPTSFDKSVMTDILIKFVNLFMPSRLSGRALSPAVVRHYTGFDWSTALALSGVYTGLYAVLYGLVASVGLVLGLRTFSRGIQLLIALSVSLYLVAGLSILLAGARSTWFERFRDWFQSVVDWIPSQSVRSKLQGRLEGTDEFSAQTERTFRALLASPRSVGLFTVGWAGTLLIVPGFRVWLLLQGANVGVPILPVVAVYVVTAYSVTILPLTPGGLGVAEVSATLVLVAAGIPHAVVAPVVVADRVLGVYVPSLLGVVPATRIEFESLF